MIYRKIKKDEAKEFAKLSATAFHGVAENQYKDIEEGEYLEETIRVLENEQGKIIAGLRLFDLQMQLDNQYVRCGGIGDVSSYPEHRRGGNISKIFDEMLREMYEDDYVISYLYPFSHPFYRKYGYELCKRKDIISLETRHISYEKDDCYAKQHIPNTEDDLSEDIKKIYTEYAKGLNFMVQREGWFWDRVLKKDPFKEKTRIYVIYNAKDEPIAYFLYEFENLSPYDYKAKTFDKGWVNRYGFDALMRFIYRLAPAVKEVSFACPPNIDPLSIADEPWEVKIKSEPGGMMRIVNVKKALKVMKKPELKCDVSVKITDDNIAANNGVYTIKQDGTVEKTDAQPDLECSIHVLAQLVCGYKILGDVSHRSDVKINGNIDELNKLFVWKYNFTQDHF